MHNSKPSAVKGLSQLSSYSLIARLVMFPCCKNNSSKNARGADLMCLKKLKTCSMQTKNIRFPDTGIK